MRTKAVAPTPMAFMGSPEPADVSRLHAEINQIVNQRFVLTTLAITVFAAAIVWMIPKDIQPAPGPVTFPFMMSTILSSLLFAIYLWSHLLKHVMRIWTEYLIAAGKSKWEVDWSAYRATRYFAYTKASTIMFLLLLAIGNAFPFLLAWGDNFTVASGAAVMSSVSGCVAALLIYLMGFHNLFDTDKKIKKKWKEVKSAPERPAEQ